MRKNVFVKSMNRQPMRTALLIVLIFLAAFAFVLRTVEYMIVRSQIMEIAEYYRGVGFVEHPLWFGDVSEAIEEIADDRRVGFEDSRRSAEGFMAGMLNADVSGMNRRAIYFPSLIEREPRNTEMYFYAYLEGFSRRGVNHHLELRICQVLVGHPEHIIVGQTLTAIQLSEFSTLTALHNMEIGQRYFFRAGYFRIYPPWGDLIGPIVPIEGRNDHIVLFPFDFGGMRLADRVFYIPAPTGTSVDFSDPQLAHIPDEIARIERNHRAMSIQTTRDMRFLPNFDNIFALQRGGRLIDENDYRLSNNVAVIDAVFANMRGVDVGDVITLQIPKNQVSAGGLIAPGLAVPFVRTDPEHPAAFYDYHELTLEIVGIIGFQEFSQSTLQSLFIWIPDSILPDDIAIAHTERELIDREWVYLPAVRLGVDFIPDAWYSFAIADSRNNVEFFNEFLAMMAELDLHLTMIFPDSVNFWVSAEPILTIILFNAGLFWLVLLAVLGLVTFLYLKQRQREFAVMRALGTPVRLIFARLLVSVLVFAMPTMIIGGAAGWFLALNEAATTLDDFEEIYMEAIPPTEFETFWASLFGDRPIPDGWGEIRQIEIGADLHIAWLWALIAIAFVILLTMIGAMGLRIMGMPVLAMLQGNFSRPKPLKLGKVAAEADVPADQSYLTKFSIPTKIPPKSAGAAISNTGIWIFRHIVRAPVKTALGLTVAMFFIFALGWINDSIDRANLEINRLYDTTYVWGEVAQNPALEMTLMARMGLDTDGPADWESVRMGWDINRGRLGNTISPGLINRLHNTQRLGHTYTEAGFSHSFVIAPNSEGTMPGNWRLQIGYLRQFRVTFALRDGVLNPLLATDNIDIFMTRHRATPPAREIENGDGTAALAEALAIAGLDDFDVRFAPDFDFSEFHHRDVNMLTSVFYRTADPNIRVPIIISENIAASRGLDIGDDAIIGYTLTTRMYHFYGVVVGIHNAQIHVADYMRDSIILPMWAYQGIIGPFSRITTFEFAIDPAYNRELNNVRVDLQESVFLGIDQVTHFTLNVDDSELIRVISSMEQTLLLLELLYPIAIVVAIAIGGGLAMLILLQNAKNAVIMRALGASGNRVRLVLLVEQTIVCLMGLAAGLAVLSIFGWGIADMANIAILYLAGVLVGSLLGALVVTGKAPLDMLQVRE